MSIYEKGLRAKYRYQSRFGLLSIEDLWELGLEDLDTVAKSVNTALKERDEESFIGSKNQPVVNKLRDSLEIVKHIIAVKLDEKDVAENAANKRHQKQELLKILHEKKTEGLKALSIEEIEKRIDNL